MTHFAGAPLPTSPDPIGVGTPSCESLSSYVQRLAKLHGTRPGQLVFRLLAWLERGEKSKAGSWAARSGRLLLRNNINGFSLANSWLRALQVATQRTGLHELTTRLWDHNFPTRGFLRSSLAWCPSCLAEDPVPFHRLSWQLQPTRVCLCHQDTLRTRCTRCLTAIPILHDRSAVTGCPRCGCDLRIADETAKPEPPSEFDTWSAGEIGRLIAASAEWHKPPSWTPAESLLRIVRAENLRGAGGLARAIGTSKVTAWYWLTGKSRPSLQFALRICHRLGRSLAEELGCRLPQPEVHNQPHQLEIHLAARAAPRQHDWPKIKRLLEDELSKPRQETEPLHVVAARLSVTARTLRAHFPSLCRRIAEHHRAKRSSQIEQRDKRLADQIATVMRQLELQQIPVTKKNVEAWLGRPGLFNRHYARRLFIQVEQIDGII
ncbi:MAG: helix-turn-helix domain-containing protein [Dechloromonas sp.]|nr:MAG: helix-turn-helix domain-containing protein [Dechloromonas sp.]